ncbi:Oxidoreductase [Rhodotorula mucilaginosa]|uniref:Mitochondrial intermembrane space import and assembly protein 40 n=1 Tax=Rhodotorula mucilaginosa TaxID=5537 RepID=A0A9P6VW72_RHOMI|nr:Oxidoreductase [Rhodotorula mucilaginosa]
MLRSAARAVPRSIYRSPTAARLRHASTDTAQRRFAVYQSQTTNPVVYASLGLAALFGWTAAILMVGGQGEKKHAATHAIEEAVTSAADATATAVTSVTSADASKKEDRKAAAPEAPSSEAAASSQAAAFNPETGEINWDCPCLGGMADGPCGEEFKAAFSCFVYSEAEPKGIDCVERFRDMQTCFRKHPDIYGDDAMDDEEDEEFDLIQRAEAALALPDEHFLEIAAESAPTRNEASAAATLE